MTTTVREFDNRDRDTVIEYQQDRIETLTRYIHQLEARLRERDEADWREKEYLVGKQR